MIKELDKIVTNCGCGGLTVMIQSNNKYQVECTCCKARGPQETTPEAAAGVWGWIVESQRTSKTYLELAGVKLPKHFGACHE